MRIAFSPLAASVFLALAAPAPAGTADGGLAPAGRPLLNEQGIEPMLKHALRFLGLEYRFGASPSREDAVDCSSLMLKAFRGVGIELPRTAHQQSKLGLKVELGKLRRGDRLYFKMTERKVPIDHTALYLGDGRMLHAFPGKGVTIEPLDDYQAVLTVARR